MTARVRQLTLIGNWIVKCRKDVGCNSLFLCLEFEASIKLGQAKIARDLTYMAL